MDATRQSYKRVDKNFFFSIFHHRILEQEMDRMVVRNSNWNFQFVGIYKPAALSQTHHDKKLGE